MHSRTYKNKNTPVTGHLSDLGTGGLAFQTTAIFYEGDQVKIQFSLHQNPLEIIGTVHRTAGKTTSVIFQPLGAAEHKIVQEFIHKHYFDPKTKSKLLRGQKKPPNEEAFLKP